MFMIWKGWRKLASIIIFLIFISQPARMGILYKHNSGYVLSGNCTKDGKIIYVGGNGPNNYSKIQDAINNASDGDTIMVFYNRYRENITIDKQLRLIGIEKDGKKPIIDGGGGDFAVNIVANNCTVKNFMITINDSITVKLSSSFNTIENCYIANPPEKGHCGYALWMIHSMHNRIANSTIESRGGAGVAIRMYRCAGNNFLNNNIIAESAYEALWIVKSSNNSFYGNRIEGVECEGSDGNFFYDNIFTSRIWIHGSKNNVFENNHIRSMVLYYAVNLTLRNNIFEGSLDLNGDKLKYYNTHVIENNTKYLRNGPKILYYKNKPDTLISGKNLAQLIVANCSNSIIRDVKIKDSSIPILVVYSNNTLIYNCSISYRRKDVGYGILLGYSSGCVIRNNNISRIKQGIQVFYSDNTKIVKNRIEEARWGIVVVHSFHTTLKRNKLYNNDCGIYLYKDLYTSVRRNDIRNNFDGMEIANALVSVIKRNNFIGNTQNTLVYKSFINIFFRNHWSNWIIPLPKPILCILLSIPWVIVIYYIIFDFCPRLIPYLIF